MVTRAAWESAEELSQGGYGTSGPCSMLRQSCFKHSAAVVTNRCLCDMHHVSAKARLQASLSPVSYPWALGFALATLFGALAGPFLLLAAAATLPLLCPCLINPLIV